MYYIDTPTRAVSAFDFDMDTGGISRRRDVIRFPDDAGWPDGMTADAEGMLWIAHWGGGRVSRWDPRSGEMIQTIRLPVSLVTSCCFGGAALDELYITTARTTLDPAALAGQPAAGNIFRCRPGTRGEPPFAFEG